MAYDSRFPFMIPLDGRPVTGVGAIELARIVRVGKTIARRTQTNPFFDLQTGSIFFARGEVPNMGVHRVPVIDAKLPEDHEVDNIVSYMNLSMVPNHVKEQWEKGHEHRNKHDKVEKKMRAIEDRTHEIEDYAAHVSRRRRGTQTVVQVL